MRVPCALAADVRCQGCEGDNAADCDAGAVRRCRQLHVSCCQVTLKGDNGDGDVSVRIQGLTPDGYLLATDDRGERYSLSPDGNSLDFFKGLVKAKLPSV